MANTSLTRTFDQVGNRQTWTLSVWIKRTGIGGQQNFFGSFPQSTDYERIMFNNDKIYMSEVGGGSTSWEVQTDAVYRDTNAWYHLVLRHDTTQASANDRIRLYMNGVQQTFGTNTQPAQNRGTAINTADVHKIGMGYSSEYTDCVMSHFHWCDGYSYGPDSFGSTDSDTGEWKINTSPSVSYGTNGFFILKDGNSVTDQGGGSHNWTVASGTLTKTEDNPSNVFATLNPLNNYYSQSTFANGNTKVTMGSTEYAYNTSTLGMTTGKWYAEFKQGSGGTDSLYGISSTQATSTSAELGNYPNDYGYYQSNGSVLTNNGSVGGWSANTWSAGDIIGVAVDLDNNKLYFSKNGTWQNSGDPTSGSTGTGAISITDVASTSLGAYFFGFSDYWGAGSSSSEANFGNGYFGTTAVSSAGTNASGNGIFEYDVPTGYTALSTKGLNT